MEHALIYCRVSTEEQAEDGHHSLATQLKLCKRAIEETYILLRTLINLKGHLILV